ncbi:MAG TPA: class I SAM-dependent methyltransferase [Steroidobacteraceae bacterium]|nr:class I SAM-dependent methyltransferase [Steroidobacteraceae bacterium]
MIDFGKTAKDYATHRAGFPASFYEWLEKYGVDFVGKNIVDIGTGTGTLARGFASRGANVIGIDPSAPLLEQARNLAARENLDIQFIVGTAESTRLADHSIDIVCAGQCWHWFDRPRAALECRRILKPGGHIIIAHFDWIPLPGNVVAETEALIQAHNPNWKMHGGTGIHGKWFVDLSGAGFSDLLSHSHDEFAPYSHEAWRGRIRASAGIAASLSPDAVAKFDAEHARLLSEKFPEEPLQTHHRVFFLLGRA